MALKKNKRNGRGIPDLVNQPDPPYTPSKSYTFTPAEQEEWLDHKTRKSIDDLSISSSVLANLLGHFGQTNNKDSFLQLLLQLGGSISQNVSGSYDEDLMQKLIEMYLSQITKIEQRNFDISALQEQRNYDSPTNQLARLMGAGVSRDAAIAMLQGTQDSPLVGSGAESSISPFQQTPSQKVAQDVNTAIGFISAVGNLVSLGFGIPQAIQQVHYLANANFLTDQQNNAYRSAGKAYSILNNAGAPAESFDSVGSAVKTIQQLSSSGNSFATDFINSGGVSDIQSNAPFASNVLRDMYKSENDSEMFRKEMKRQDLQNELTNAQVETEYQNIMESLQRVLESDERIKLYREQLLTQKEITRQETYAAEFAEFQGDILENMKSLRDSQGNSVVTMMSFNQFNDVWIAFRESVARSSDPAKFDKWCQDNWSAVCDLATIQQIANSNYVTNLGRDDDEDPSFMSQILRFSRLLNDSGLGAQIQGFVSNSIGAANTLNSFLNPAQRTNNTVINIPKPK